jgi:hypothetical protein
LQDTEKVALPVDLKSYTLLTYSLNNDNEDFIKNFEATISNFISHNINELPEHIRLLEKGEYNAAVILAFRKLENTLLSHFGDCNSSISPLSLLNQLNSNTPENKRLLLTVKEYRSTRNNIIHKDINITKKESTKIVKSVDDLCKAIDNFEVIFL